jgi:predicted enzyme related to lactoylglutathione lyase
MTNVLFAVMPTADLDVAITWYEVLWNRPADIIATEDEVMWRICDGGWLVLVRDPGRAGHALVHVAVDDLDRALAEMSGRGLDRPPVETIEGAGRKAPFLDPDGNAITLLEVTASGR